MQDQKETERLIREQLQQHCCSEIKNSLCMGLAREPHNNNLQPCNIIFISLFFLLFLTKSSESYCVWRICVLCENSQLCAACYTHWTSYKQSTSRSVYVKRERERKRNYLEDLYEEEVKMLREKIIIVVLWIEFRVVLADRWVLNYIRLCVYILMRGGFFASHS